MADACGYASFLLLSYANGARVMMFKGFIRGRQGGYLQQQQNQSHLQRLDPWHA